MTSYKLYVWEGVLTDYTDGIIFALAETAEQARESVALAEYDEDTQYFKMQCSREEYLDKFRRWRNGEKVGFIYPNPNSIGSTWNEIIAEPTIHESPVGYYLYGGG
jgi:hypothetical protein